MIDHGPLSHAHARRLPGLDLLRALAIAWVMLFHAQIMGMISADNPIAAQGWVGVDLFFALSGFLIGGQILRPFARGERLNLGRFYLRRLLRTLPPYLVVLGFYFTVPAFREQPQIPPLWQFVSFTENLFVDIAQPKAFSHVWSLCIEEQFYLVAPLVVWLLMRRPSRTKGVLALCAVLAAGVVWRALVWRHDLAPLLHVAGGEPRFWILWQAHIYYSTVARLDDLAGGVALAAIKTFWPRAWAVILGRANLVGGLGLVAAGLAIWISLQPPSLIGLLTEFPVLGLGTTLLVAAGAGPHGLIGRWRLPGAGVLAAMAYSLYLTHKAVYHLTRLTLGAQLDHHPWAAALIYGGAALAAGAWLYLAVERPALWLRDRLIAS